ncbi:aldo-keto reductase family 1 member C15-like [Arvicola amphibius]|uniref:aldo-keto reductase family 1 member C15-like n=1 Tax=Arvicola amphibius TaxID=1047088 RepID=UPI001C09379F|nr:aldo-keto reductase family 1 member C15-like [Arvicola amphibius]XP_041911128.1 aldo-keto reductase family 1 member C15-like [Arvicola amphibius]
MDNWAWAPLGLMVSFSYGTCLLITSERLINSEPGEELLPKDCSGKNVLDVVDIRDTWEALEKCKDLGLTKSIGVSNFNHKLLELILNKPGLKYKPTCNQS